MARRAQAAHVSRDQSGGRERARRQGRRLGLGHGPPEQLESSHENAGDRAGRRRPRVDAISFRRLVPGRRSAQQISEGGRPDRAWRERELADDLWLRSGDGNAGTQGYALPDKARVKEAVRGLVLSYVETPRA